MPVGISNKERGDHWSSGHEHLAKQERLGEIHPDLVSVPVTNENGQVFRVFAKAPEPNLIQRIAAALSGLEERATERILDLYYEYPGAPAPHGPRSPREQTGRKPTGETVNSRGTTSPRRE